jgi:hypothetical protein
MGTYSSYHTTNHFSVKGLAVTARLLVETVSMNQRLLRRKTSRNDKPVAARNRVTWLSRKQGLLLSKGDRNDKPVAARNGETWLSRKQGLLLTKGDRNDVGLPRTSTTHNVLITAMTSLLIQQCF